MRRFLGILVLATALPSHDAASQVTPAPTGLELLERVVEEVRRTELVGPTPLLAPTAQDPAEALDPGERAVRERETRVSSVIEIALILTLLSLAPALLLSVTSFTRIVIVLSFVRRALSVQELPPNQVLIGLAIFLTLFCMAPVIGAVHDQAVTPYLNGEVRLEEAGQRAAKPLRAFLLANTRESDLALFAEVSGREEIASPEETPLTIAIPAFVLSELKTAFQMGFLIFLPFLVIDFVVSSILLSMGMFMLPPIVISTPFKILLFVLVDGWNLVITSLVRSVALA